MSGDSGRFLGRDPITFAAGQWSIFAFVNDSPLANRDPIGLARVECHCLTNRYGHLVEVECANGDSPNKCCEGKCATFLSANFVNPPKLDGICAGVRACPGCSEAACNELKLKYEEGILNGDKWAYGIMLFPELFGFGPYGGVCHRWSAGFHSGTVGLPENSSACLKVSSVTITTDGPRPWFQWRDHSVNIIRNRCTGRCTIVDDGFFGQGSVYDPCRTPMPDMLGNRGQPEWMAIRASCGCPGVPGPGPSFRQSRIN